MKNILVVVFSLLISFVSLAQDLRTITNTNKNYKIDIPENWKENKMFYSASLSLMALKPKSNSDPNPYEAIAIKHYTTTKTNFKEAFDDHIKRLKNYYKSNFEIISSEKLHINGRPLIKLIIEVTSQINGKKKKNTLIFSFANQELTVMTLTSSIEKFDKNVETFKEIYSSFTITNDHEVKEKASFTELLTDIKRADLTSPETYANFRLKYKAYKILKLDFIFNEHKYNFINRLQRMKEGEVYSNPNREEIMKLIDRQYIERIKISTIALVDSTRKGKALAEKILNAYKNGTPFSELAKTYSRDKFYAEKGGNVGWIKRGQLVKEIDGIVFTKKKGDIFSIKTLDWGWNVILIEESAKLDDWGEVALVRN